ncbi:MAG: SDR family oxidoreductase [Candidatus Latescibacterota bacterium]|nr:MAG: SDR family oxidoreductase [Candidatus Latescibacterota bacterium]
MKLDASRILITGGSLGIGKATAKLFVEGGAKVGITGRDSRRLERAATETGSYPIVADVGDPKDVGETYKRFLDEFGGLECLVNNAGIGLPRYAEDVTLDDLETVFRTNVFGAALMTAEAVKIFKKQNRGHIVNVGSTAGLKGYERGTVYAASKFALRGMTMCWQAELRKHNIRVFLINPSEVATAIGSPDRVERTAPPNKLRSLEIAYAIKSVLEMDDRGFVPEFSVWATNPW